MRVRLAWIESTYSFDPWSREIAVDSGLPVVAGSFRCRWLPGRIGDRMASRPLALGPGRKYKELSGTNYEMGWGQGPRPPARNGQGRRAVALSTSAA